jgi:hypothetical protein
MRTKAVWAGQTGAVRPSVTYLVAAALTAAALALPLWGFAMSAPQYPGETLHLQVTRAGIVGDVQEIETLQHFIGVRFPTDLPELRWVTRAIAGLAILLFVAAFVKGTGGGRAFRALVAVGLCGFLAASAWTAQRRLYEVGHDRDPKAPIRALHDFTPPLVGPVRVGNFTVWSYPHFGGAALALAAVLALAGLRRHANGAGLGGVRVEPDRSRRNAA